MITLHRTKSRKSSKLDQGTTRSASATRVRELLLEIAIAMHATRAVGFVDGRAAPKKG